MGSELIICHCEGKREREIERGEKERERERKREREKERERWKSKQCSIRCLWTLNQNVEIDPSSNFSFCFCGEWRKWFLKVGHSRPLFSSFQLFTVNILNIISCRWVDSNCESLVLEATVLPTEPQPLPFVYKMGQPYSFLITWVSFRWSWLFSNSDCRILKKQNFFKTLWLYMSNIIYQKITMSSNPDSTSPIWQLLGWSSR